MNNFGGPYFDPDNSPFCPATGKLIRFCKGGGQKPQAAAASRAEETPQLVGQAIDDDFANEQDRRKRNQSVIASTAEATFGQKLKLGQ